MYQFEWYRGLKTRLFLFKIGRGFLFRKEENMDFKNEVVDLVASQVDLPKEKITALIERPKNAKMGD